MWQFEGSETCFVAQTARTIAGCESYNSYMKQGASLLRSLSHAQPLVYMSDLHGQGRKLSA
jgi:hypothetical protein